MQSKSREKREWAVPVGEKIFYDHILSKIGLLRKTNFPGKALKNDQKDSRKTAEMDGQQEKKKKFITEKIVGRELSLRRAVRYVLLAAACGAVFGLCAAAAFSLIRGNSGKQTEEETTIPETRQQEAEEQTEEVPEEEIPAETVPEETTEDIEAIVRQEVEQHELTEKDFGAMLSRLRESAERADAHIVSIQAVKRDTGWFNDTIETARLAAGVIISTADPEIRILTTAEAVSGADALHVTFRDRTEREAGIKQISKTDGMAVIAVPKSGLGTEFLSSISPVRLAAADPSENGVMVIAAGAPLGTAHSVDFGFIGYIAGGELTADGTRNVFYADLQADTERGTFLFNVDGELLGMTQPARQDSTAGTGKTADVLSVSWLRRILASLSEGRAVPYLGIYGRTVSPEMEAEHIPRGVFITDVEQNSPAYAAGVKSGDVVTAVNGAETHSITGYASAVGAAEAGTEVKLSVMRGSGGGEYRGLEFTMTVGTR